MVANVCYQNLNNACKFHFADVFTVMKVASKVAKVILGIGFIVFGLNGFLGFIPIPPPAGENAKTFLGVLAATHYLSVVKALEMIGGIMVFSGRLAPLGLVILTPILVNILLYDALMDPAGLPIAVILFALDIFLIFRHKEVFTPFFRIREDQCTLVGKND